MEQISPQPVIVYHGTSDEEIAPGALRPDCGDPEEPSSVGLWTSTDLQDALTYAGAGGVIHVLDVSAAEAVAMTASTWDEVKEQIRDLGGPFEAAAEFKSRGFGAIRIDRGSGTPVEWILLDPSLATTLRLERVVNPREAITETEWTPDAAPGP